MENRMSSSVSEQPALPLPSAAVASPHSSPTERIGVLDVLRGIALLGMFVVHFYDNWLWVADSPAAAAQRVPWVDTVISLFFDGRFYTMFGILFGIGFAVQLQRADARGERFTARYVRRVLMLAVFGLIAEGVFGYNVLLGYALWALPLLVVRRWPMRALVVLLVLCAASRPINTGTRFTVLGRDRFVSQVQAKNAAFRAASDQRDKDTEARDWRTVIGARVRFMPAFYKQWDTLPWGSFTLFLIGLIGFRLGLFDHPEAHRRMIIALMVAGCASWAVANWVLPIGGPMSLPAPGASPLDVMGDLARGNALFLVRDQWLSFTYIGAVLLLVAHDRAWLTHLSPFAWAGRMALTNYMAQVILLDTLFSRHGLGLTVSPLMGPVYAVALFTAQVLFSRWWLARYRLGPLEWVWRSVTYWKLQPQRIAVPVTGAVPVAA
jgi:uncharacterized protein